MESISCWILSFKSSKDQGRCLKTFSFRYLQRKKSHGLKSDDRAGHSMSPPKEIKRLGNISLNTRSERRAVWAVAPSCWNHTSSVSTSSSLRRRKVSSISTYRSEVTVTVAPPSSKKVRSNHTKFGNCTPNSYTRRVERSFLEFTRVTFSPVAKILLVYGSTEVEVSLNALCVAIAERLFS